MAGTRRHEVGVHRYYDPASGQFLTVDPLIDETEQAYAYTAGDPVNRYDLTGTAPELGDGGALGGFGAEGAGYEFGGEGTLVEGTADGTVRISDVGKGRAFSSFKSFKSFFGRAGDDMDWHHLVEQNPANIDRFGKGSIQNTSNIVRVDRSVNQKLNGFYSSIQPGTDGLTVRRWLSTKSFEFQRNYGLKQLARFGRQ